MAAVDGLGTDCAQRDGGGTVWTVPVSSAVANVPVAVLGKTLIVLPAAIVTGLRAATCISGSIVKPSGRPAIVASECLTVAKGLIVKPK
eukprot:4512000-Amphidinium_carterae.1